MEDWMASWEGLGFPKLKEASLQKIETTGGRRGGGIGSPPPFTGKLFSEYRRLSS